MLVFVALTNILLITSLISLLSNKLDTVSTVWSVRGHFYAPSMKTIG
jgi:hypothetical protein